MGPKIGMAWQAHMAPRSVRSPAPIGESPNRHSFGLARVVNQPKECLLRPPDAHDLPVRPSYWAGLCGYLPQVENYAGVDFTGA